MQTPKPKSLADFPKLAVIAVTAGMPVDGGYQLFEIEAAYDPILEDRFEQMLKGEIAQWFWLLYGEQNSLHPMLMSFDKQTKIARLSCEAKDEPKIVGRTLAYLSPYWQAFNVWMVLNPHWDWEKKRFQGTDAYAEEYEAQVVSLIEGREIKVWTKLEPIGKGSGQSRHYPSPDQTLPVRPGTRIEPGAWGHEHCVLCNDHIYPDMFGYCDPDERWMCEQCYDRYAARHDLAFVDEL
jgi:hypothetical protein